MNGGLTQDGWVDPVETHRCTECKCKYKLVGVFDIEEDEGICPDCEREIEQEENNNEI